MATVDLEQMIEQQNQREGFLAACQALTQQAQAVSNAYSADHTSGAPARAKDAYYVASDVLTAQNAVAAWVQAVNMLGMETMSGDAVVESAQQQAVNASGKLALQAIQGATAQALLLVSQGGPVVAEASALAAQLAGLALITTTANLPNVQLGAQQLGATAK